MNTNTTSLSLPPTTSFVDYGSCRLPNCICGEGKFIVPNEGETICQRCPHPRYNHNKPDNHNSSSSSSSSSSSGGTTSGGKKKKEKEKEKERE
jgi:hypothetical protein